jgi:hypothetical protein
VKRYNTNGKFLLGMALEDVQCPESGCGGMVQFTIDSDEEITNVRTAGWAGGKECPECGTSFKISTS